MILSALLTSVGINVALCFLFLILYTMLRNRSNYAELYVPRLLAEGEFQEENDFGFRRFFSSLVWVKRAWEPTEDELLQNSGLDAVVFMRIFIFGLRVFRFAAIVGIFILLPFNYMGNQLNIDFTDFTNKSLETFSISNGDDGSNRNMTILQQCGFLTSILQNLGPASSLFWFEVFLRLLGEASVKVLRAFIGNIILPPIFPIQWFVEQAN